MKKDEEKKLADIVMNKVISDKDIKALVDDKTFHDLLEGKKYDYDFTVRLQGSFQQGYDYQGEISQRVKWQQMFIALLEEHQKVCLSAKVTGINLKTIAKQAAKLETELADVAEAKAKQIAEEIKETSTGMIRGRMSCKTLATVVKSEVAFIGDVEKKEKK